MKHKIRQSGFSTLELLLAVIVVCLLGAIGYLVYTLYRPAPSASTLSAADASAIVDRAKYVISYDTDNHGSDVAQRLHSAGYFTQKLSDYVTQQETASPEGVGEDSIICAQGLPASWSYGTPQLGNSSLTATLLITGNYSAHELDKIATSWVKINGVWQENSIMCVRSAPSTPTQSLTVGGLHFTYDPTIWSLGSYTGADPRTGISNSADIDYQDSGFVLTVDTGQIAGGCHISNTSYCVAQSEKLASVTLSSTKTAAIFAQRLSIDGGQAWEYQMWLADTSACGSFQTCPLTTPGLASASFLIEGYYVKNAYSATKTVASLDDFAALAPVQAALQVLKSATY